MECNHPNSRLARLENNNAIPRTQSSIAISSDRKSGTFLMLLNLRQQLWENPELMPSPDDPLRYSPIMGVILTNADVDHTAGLINLKNLKSLTFMPQKEY